MSQFSNQLETDIINHFARPGNSVTAPTGVYLALYTTDPTEANTGTEVTTSGTAYARQAITFGAPADDGAGRMQSSNTGALTFAVATANYGTVTHVGVRDTASGAGKLLWYGVLTTARTINTGEQFIVAIGDLIIKAE